MVRDARECPRIRAFAERRSFVNNSSAKMSTVNDTSDLKNLDTSFVGWHTSHLCLFRNLAAQIGVG